MFIVRFHIAVINMVAAAGLVGRHCKTMQVQQNDNTITVDFDCGEPNTLQVAIDMSFKFCDARHYAGTVKSSYVFEGHETSTEKTINAKRIDPVCKSQ